MTATLTSYEIHDHNTVAAVLQGLSDSEMQAVVGTGYLGHLEENIYPLETLEPSTDTSNPTMLAVWSIDYERAPEATLDGDDQDPERHAIVRCLIFIQPGAGVALCMLASEQYRLAFQASQNTGNHVYDIESPPIRHGVDPGTGFYRYEIPIHFTGGANSG